MPSLFCLPSSNPSAFPWAGPLAEEEFLLGAAAILTIPADKASAYLRDKTLVLRDELLLRDRSDMYRQAYRYAVRFTNRKRQSAGLSTQVFIAPVPIPAPPGKPVAEIAQDWIRTSWKPPTEN